MTLIPGNRAKNTKKFQPTKECLSLLRELSRSGKKSIVYKAQQAITEAQNLGELQLMPTNHGETRIPDCEKYNLGDGYRLVVQYTGDLGLFLFVGSHDDTDQWLENHKKKRIIIGDDQRISIVPISESPSIDITNTFNADSRPELANQPLLKFGSDDIWSSIGLMSDD